MMKLNIVKNAFTEHISDIKKFFVTKEFLKNQVWKW